MNKKMKAVFTIVDDEKLERPMFRRIGTAFVNRDDSLNVYLDAYPANAKLHIRDIELRGEQAPEAPGGDLSAVPIQGLLASVQAEIDTTSSNQRAAVS